MNNFFYRLAKTIRPIPINILAKMTGHNLILPFYHAISDKPMPFIKHLYPIRGCQSFEQDLDFLLKHYHPVSIDQLIDHVNNQRPLKKNAFSLSFDDGLKVFHDIAAPILLKKGIPATCFINSGFMNNKDLFFRYKASLLLEHITNIKHLPEEVNVWFKRNHFSINHVRESLLSINYSNRYLLDELAHLLGYDFTNYLKEHQPYMNQDEINKLLKQGFHFGAHSIDHPYYTELDNNEQLKQTRESMNALSQIFHLSPKAFSFPFTDDAISKNFFEQIFHTEKNQFDITFGCAGIKNDLIPLHLQRIPIENGHWSAKEIIYGEYFYYIAKALIKRNTIKRL